MRDPRLGRLQWAVQIPYAGGAAWYEDKNQAIEYAARHGSELVEVPFDEERWLAALADYNERDEARAAERKARKLERAQRDVRLVSHAGHGCHSTHTTYAAFAKCRWPRPANVQHVFGEGRYGVYIERHDCYPSHNGRPGGYRVAPDIHLMQTKAEAIEFYARLRGPNLRPTTHAFELPANLADGYYEDRTIKGIRSRYEGI